MGLSHIKAGPPGPQGPQGPAGTQGPQGAAGANGVGQVGATIAGGTAGRLLGVAAGPVLSEVLVGAGLTLAGGSLSSSTMAASGVAHAPGLVPDPGSTAGATRFLREDATFAVPAATVPGGTSGRVALVGPSGVVTDSSGVNFDAPSSTLTVTKGVGGGRSCLGLESGGTRWGVGLGDEAIAHFYVGSRDSLTANWFWRGNWNDGSIPGNTFRVASGQDGVTTLGVEAVAGQTAPLVALRGLSSTATARAVAYLDAGFNTPTDASYKGFARLDAVGSGGREYGLRIDATGSGANAAFFGPGSYGGGVGCVFLPDRAAAPTTDPVGGGLLYAESGQPVWRDPAGTVTTLTAGGAGTVTGVGLTVPAGLTVAGSPVTTSGTLAISTTLSGVVKGTGTGFTNAVAGTDYLAPTGNGSGLTGLTGAQIGGNIAGNAANVTGTVAVANGGTGQVTAQAARNALLPAQATNSGKYLTTDGTDVSWAAVAGGGGSVFVASGASHASGLVPDPGATAGTTKFLREDATWQVPGGGGVAIGDAIGGATAGRVLYAGTSGVLADSASLAFDGAMLTINGTTVGNDGFGALVVADASANRIFRGLVSGAWVDSVTATFFQVGPLNGNALFTSASGEAFTRFQINALALQVGSETYGFMPAPTAVFEVVGITTATATVSEAVKTRIRSTGTPSDGFGARHLWQLESSTTNGRDAASLDVAWSVATDASRLADMILSTAGWNGAHEGMRFRDTGSISQPIIPIANVRDAADDTAAAALSPACPIGGLYRTGSILKIRVS